MGIKNFKKSAPKFLVITGLGLFLILFYQNCSQSHVDTGLSNGLTQQDVLQQKALGVLVNRCSSCHNADLKSGGIDVMNISEMLALGVVIPGEPAISLVFTQISGGAMPPSKSLAQADIDAIYSWIADGLKTTTTPIGLPTPTTTVLEAKYASIYQNILKSKCLGCHNSNSSNGVNFSSYNATMNTVQKTLPMSSGLYTSVATRRTMPKNAPGSLSAVEIKAIFDWITAGAINN
jgi:mono/diheme cytochrome c family protein